MPTPKKGPRLGDSPSHQRLILSNLATQLFDHTRTTTTEAKARTLRPLAEKLITKAKKGDLHNRRVVLKTVRDKSVVHTLFTEIAPLAVIELVTEAYSPKPKSAKATRTEQAPAAAPAAEETTEVEAPAEETATDAAP